MIKLPYIGIMAKDYVTRYGYSMVEGVEKYRGVRCRNNVVIRVDVLSKLTNCFNEAFLTQYRQLVFSFMSGQVLDPDTLVQIIQCFYVQDNTFKMYMGEIFHFKDNEGKSLYNAVIDDLLLQYKRAINPLLESISERGYKRIVISEGYVYFSIPDEYNAKVVLPRGYRKEIVSYAKNWPGTFEEY